MSKEELTKTEETAEKTTFKVMTFNIQHGEVWEAQKIDLAAFGIYVRSKSPDVCGLNEVRGQGSTNPEYTNQAPTIGAIADYNSYFGESVKIYGTDPYGNAILSKTSFKSVETVKIPDPADLEWNETRSVIKAVTELGGREVCFLVSHFGLTDVEKTKAVETVCGLIDAIDMPLVLMGDFNMCPDDEKLIPIRERLTDSDDTAETGGQFTFATYDPQIKIDYIFYKGLDCLSCTTLTEPLSDHFPIICEFTFKKDSNEL